MDSYFRWFGLPGSVVLSILMSFLALVLALCHPTPIRWICFAAMLLSSGGDVFLARFKCLDRIFPNCFTIGAGFFMAAHFLYILCYGMKLRAAEAPFWNVGSCAAILLGIAITVAFVVLCGTTGNTNMLVLILLYAVIISGNCATVWSFAWSQGIRSASAVCAAIGVISFLLSDVVIGLGVAGNIHQYDGWIWWLYPIGQILLILGV